MKKVHIVHIDGRVYAEFEEVVRTLFCDDGKEYVMALVKQEAKDDRDIYLVLKGPSAAFDRKHGYLSDPLFISQVSRRATPNYNNKKVREELHTLAHALISLAEKITCPAMTCGTAEGGK